MFDGCASGALMIQFLRTIKPDVKIDYVPSMNKKHGLIYEDLANFTRDEYGLFIIPDASVDCKNARMIKQNFSGDILVLDHHIIETEYLDKMTGNWITKFQADEIRATDPSRIEEDCYTNYCTNINCMDGQYPNTTLSGTGVCQKLVEAYVDTYGLDKELKTYFYDLVSTSEISDVMDLRDNETRYYTLAGLKEQHWNNEFLNELADRKNDNLPFGRYIGSMGWNIIPIINGTVRYGKPDEIIDMYKAMAGEQETREYQPKRRHKEDPLPEKQIQTLQKFMARVCDNVKARQDNQVRDMTKTVDAVIQENHLDENSVIFVDATKLLTTGTVTGLIAGKLTNKYFRPVVLMRSKNGMEYGGSMRNFSRGNIENLKIFLEQAGITVMGHENSAGVLFTKSKLDEIIANCNKQMPLDQMSICYTCDWAIPAEQLKKEYVSAVAENYAIFGGPTVQEPMFVIPGLEINAAQIQATGEGAVNISFTYKGIKFIKKFCSRREFEEMTKLDRYTMGVNKKRVKLDLICNFVLDKWEENSEPQVKILAFQSEEIGRAINSEVKSNFEFEKIESSIAAKKNAAKLKTNLDDFAW